MRAPLLERRERPFELHGMSWNDPYEWTRTKASCALRAEEEYAVEHLAALESDVQQLIASTADELVDSELGFPQRQGDWWVFPDLPDAARRPRIVRVRARGAEPPDRATLHHDDIEVLVDFEEVLETPTTQVGAVHLSPCERYIAWTEDPDGRESYDVRVRLLETGRDIDTGIQGVASTVVFSGDGNSFFVVELDEVNRPAIVRRHQTLHPADARTVCAEPDRRFRLRVSRSTSNRMVFINASARDTSRVSYLDADDPAAVLHTLDGLAADETASCAHLEHDDMQAFVITVSSPIAPCGAVFLAQLDAAGVPEPRSHWRTLLSHDQSRRLSPSIVLRGHVLVGMRERGRDTIWTARVMDLERGAQAFKPISLWQSTDARLLQIPEWATTQLIVGPASFVHPPSAFRVDLDDPSIAHPINGALVATDDYVEYTLEALSPDGTRVPMTIVRRANTPLGAPAVLSGYGAYEVSQGRRYNPMMLRLLDRGVVFAVAHVRGGGENGPGWHDAARGVLKPRSFDDFLACRDELVSSGLAADNKIVAIGGSAGGLLVAASLNRRPSAFAGIAVDVPFVDPLTTMMQPDLPLTVSDRAEWGDPLVDPAVARCMRSYSPYHNVRATAYPPVFASCGLNDNRVAPIEPLKWINQLRHAASGGPFILSVRPGGHSGQASLDNALRDLATEYAWISACLGVTPV